MPEFDIQCWPTGTNRAAGGVMRFIPIKVGGRRVKLAFDGREAWGTPKRVRKTASNV